MYQNILVPIAFDDNHKPDVALNTARTLAGDNATVTLVHILGDVPRYARGYLPEGFDREREGQMLSELKLLAAEFPKGAAAVRHGHPATEILACIDELGADCVIIDSHRPGIQDYLLGSTAARVVRHAPCPVMVLR